MSSTLPKTLHAALLGIPATAQLATGRMFLPADRGECIIVHGRRSVGSS